MSAARLKLALILAGLVSAALVLLSWTQDWFALVLVDGQPLAVSGQAAAPALSALGLASLALMAALAIARRVLRVVLGVLQAGFGVLVVVVATGALSDPIAASAQAVTDATAIAGPSAIAALVATITTSAWPTLAVVGGALEAAVGLAVVLTSSRWPQAARKYESTAADGGSAGAWDTLSGGGDPT